MGAIAAGGLVAFALTLTFAIFDWLMSLDPHWFSTIFGVYYFAGGATRTSDTSATSSFALDGGNGKAKGITTDGT